MDRLLETVRPAIVPPFSALFLYGSFARGDQDRSSDIDILQVTPTHTAPYASGKINITCYTADQLRALASNGALFAKHLVLEAVPLVDPASLLDKLKSIFTAPSDYRYLCRDVTDSVALVAVTEDTFRESPKHYSATAGYLLRTYVYARAFDLGAKSFSMRHVTELTGDDRPRERLVALRPRKTYSSFRSVVDLLFELTQTAPFSRQESLEAFVVNSYGSCDLAVILGLRILARGGLIGYPLTQGGK
jgi:hypothetical protein